MDLKVLLMDMLVLFARCDKGFKARENQFLALPVVTCCGPYGVVEIAMREQGCQAGGDVGA